MFEIVKVGTLREGDVAIGISFIVRLTQSRGISSGGGGGGTGFGGGGVQFSGTLSTSMLYFLPR